MSIASLKQSREAKYQRLPFDPAARSYWANENYYDMDDILVTGRDTNFIFDQDTPKGLFFKCSTYYLLIHLHLNLDLFPLINQPRQTTIPPRGINLPIKMWQLQALRFCGTIILPDDYKSLLIESIRVGANVAKLTEKKDFFYEKGYVIARYLSAAEAKRVSSDLLNTLLHRSKYIFLRTLDLQSTANLKFSNLELCIYNKGQYTEQRLMNWRKDVPRRKQNCQRAFRQYT